MKIQTECVPCLLKRVIYETELVSKDKDLKKKVIQNACKTLSKFYDPNVCSASIATKVHKLVYEDLGNVDPYFDLKNISNDVAMSLVPEIEKLIEDSDDPLKMSMICAIIGNLMDFGIEGGSSHPEMLKDVFDNNIKEGLGYDDYDILKDLIKDSKNILFFSDNCGEIVFDKILCREIKKFNPDLNLTLVVRGEPIISDATLDDAMKLSMDEVVDDIMTTGCFAIGVDFQKLPENLNNALKKADLIICKGMANYEAFSETNYHPVAYLLRTKCNAIANSMKIPLDINVIKVYK